MEAEKFDEAELLAKVNKSLEGSGCIATGLGPYAVGVQGDYRVYWPSVFVTFPKDISKEKLTEISNKITNEVRGISRVLMNIPTS